MRRIRGFTQNRRLRGNVANKWRNKSRDFYLKEPKEQKVESFATICKLLLI